MGRRVFQDACHIKQRIRSYFKQLYDQDRGLFIKMKEGLVNKISEIRLANHEIMPSVEEVKEDVWACDSNKAPALMDIT